MIRYAIACAVLCIGTTAYAAGHPSGAKEEQRLFALEFEYVVVCREFPFPQRLVHAIIEGKNVHNAVEEANDEFAMNNTLLTSGCFLAVREEVRIREVVFKYLFEETFVWYHRVFVGGESGYFVLVVPNARRE